MQEMIILRFTRLLWLLLGVACLVVASVLGALMWLRAWDQVPEKFWSAVVAANGVECADIGKQILLMNGSASDAAIATLFCEGVSCPQCMGLGGGFLLTIYSNATGEVEVLNSREVAPAGTSERMFDNASSTVGGLAIAVPAELRGYGALHKRYGRLPWSELVKPTAELCKNGHAVNDYLARMLKKYRTEILSESSMRSTFVNPKTGDVYEQGDKIKRLKLGKTLDVIAKEGAEALHNGSLAKTFAEDIQKFGGIVTEEDLRNYQPKWEKPIKVLMKDDSTLYTAPLPGSGALLAFILNMLNGFVGTSDAPFNSNVSWHRIVETFKYAYAWRTSLGDPGDENSADGVSMLQLQEMLSRPEFAKLYRDLVLDNQTFDDWRHYGAAYSSVPDYGTAHVVVVAPDGDAVSATSTINYVFGCQRLSSSTGILLNNQMDDFSIAGRLSSYGLPPSPSNVLAAGRRPLSSMVPSLVVDGAGLRLAVGAAGGTKITSQVALVVLGTILEGADFSEVMLRPRLHHQLLPMEVQHEADFDPEVIKALQRLGHATKVPGDTGFAAVVGAARDSRGLYVARTDKNRPGSVSGF